MKRIEDILNNLRSLVLNLTSQERKKLGRIYEVYNIMLKEYKKEQKRKPGRPKKMINILCNQQRVNQFYQEDIIMSEM